MRKKKLLQNLYLKLRNSTSFFYQAIEIVVDCILNRFKQKDHIDTLQKMAILLLKTLVDEDFDHELRQIFQFFSSELHKFKLETQLKTLIYIVDETEVAITITLSLNASQKLLVSELLKLVTPMLNVPATNAVSERSCSTLHKFKLYLRSSITQELSFFLNYCYL